MSILWGNEVQVLPRPWIGALFIYRYTMSKKQWKAIDSNFRASRREGLAFSKNSFPIWGDESLWEWAAYAIALVYGEELC